MWKVKGGPTTLLTRYAGTQGLRKKGGRFKAGGGKFGFLILNFGFGIEKGLRKKV